MNDWTGLDATGIAGLDEVMLGGFVEGHSVMIAGYTGTGKTVLGISLIVAGILEHDQHGVIVSFEQLPESLYRDARSLGFDLRSLEREDKLRVIFVSPATLVEEIVSQIGKITELLLEVDARRLFIDGINVLDTVEGDPLLRRQLIDRIIAAFRREGLNVYFSREKPELAPLGSSPESFIADIVLQLTYAQQHNRRTRYMEVVKSRGQESLNGLHTFMIGRGGVTIFPRQKIPLIQPRSVSYGEPRLAFGVPDLDTMLGGGVFKRSSTLVAGSSGTGKSMLCLQFIVHGARRGEPGLFVSLDEAAEQVIENARTLAPDIDELLRSGAITILRISPLETDINEQVVRVRETLRAAAVQRLAFDSLSNYEDVLDDVEYKDYVYALMSFVKASGVTALFTSEVRGLTEVERISTHGTSYLLDNIIMLRFVELSNALRRALVVLKTRGSDHASDIREYIITQNGIHIVPLDPRVTVPVLSFQQYAHILTGRALPRGPRRQTRRRQADADQPEQSSDG